MWSRSPVFRATNIDRQTSTSLEQRSRRRDALELAGIYGLILVVIWTPQPYQWALWGVAIVLTLAVLAQSYDGLRSMGMCTQNLSRSLWGVGVAMVVAIVSVCLAMQLHTLHLPSTVWSCIGHYGGYAVFAVAQQILLQCFFLSRSMRLLSNGTAAAGLSAVLFAVAHLPNPVLTAITLVAGLASCLFFLRYRNIWPLAAAHAILGIAIAITIPNQIDRNMRVGISYLTWADGTAMANTAVNHPSKP